MGRFANRWQDAILLASVVAVVAMWGSFGEGTTLLGQGGGGVPYCDFSSGIYNESTCNYYQCRIAGGYSSGDKNEICFCHLINKEIKPGAGEVCRASDEPTAPPPSGCTEEGSPTSEACAAYTDCPTGEVCGFVALPPGAGPGGAAGACQCVKQEEPPQPGDGCRAHEPAGTADCAQYNDCAEGEVCEFTGGFCGCVKKTQPGEKCSKQMGGGDQACALVDDCTDGEVCKYGIIKGYGQCSCVKEEPDVGPKFCSKNQDCADEDTCTEDKCIDGQCQYEVTDRCDCQSDPDAWCQGRMTLGPSICETNNCQRCECSLGFCVNVFLQKLECSMIAVPPPMMIMAPPGGGGGQKGGGGGGQPGGGGGQKGGGGGQPGSGGAGSSQSGMNRKSEMSRSGFSQSFGLENQADLSVKSSCLCREEETYHCDIIVKNGGPVTAKDLTVTSVFSGSLVTFDELQPLVLLDSGTIIRRGPEPTLEEQTIAWMFDRLESDEVVPSQDGRGDVRCMGLGICDGSTSSSLGKKRALILVTSFTFTPAEPSQLKGTKTVTVVAANPDDPRPENNITLEDLAFVRDRARRSDQCPSFIPEPGPGITVTPTVTPPISRSSSSRKSPPSHCGDCGVGILNICDEEECKDLGSCDFAPNKFFGMTLPGGDCNDSGVPPGGSPGPITPGTVTPGTVVFVPTITPATVTPGTVVVQPTVTPGTVTPGTVVTQGTVTPGTVTPGTVTPGTTTPGTVTPGTVVIQGTTTPSTVTPGTVIYPGTVTPSTVTPGRVVTPGTTTPGTVTPGTVVTQGTVTPGTITPGTATPPPTSGQPRLCGNGIVDPGEQCGEQGVRCSVADTCNYSMCRCFPKERCGNGLIEEGEQCGESGLRCPSGTLCNYFMCQCFGGGDMSDPDPQRGRLLCGNGIVDPGEQCGEQGIRCAVSDICNYSMCQCFPKERCGNGLVEEGEQCGEQGLRCASGTFCNYFMCQCFIDPSSPSSGTATPATPTPGTVIYPGTVTPSTVTPGRVVTPGTITPGTVTPGTTIPPPPPPVTIPERICGNEILDIGEQCDHGGFCDGGPLTGLELLSQEDVQVCIEEGGRPIPADGDGCSAKCRVEYCGDGVVQLLGHDGVEGTPDDEECDPEPVGRGPGGQDGAPSGTGQAPGGIREECDTRTCRFIRCGDGVRQGSEQCDDGNDDIYDRCMPNCRLPVCGNRVVEGFEECDDGNLMDGDGCFDNCALMIPPERLP